MAVNAAFFKRLLSGGPVDFAAVERLSAEDRALAFLVLSEGVDLGKRAARLRAELVAQNKLDAWEAIQQADPDAENTWADPWQYFSLADAMAPQPPLRFVVAGFLPRPSVAIFFGPPKNYKTLLAMDLATSVSAGQVFLPPLPGKAGGAGFATSQAPVLWLDFENGPRRMAERFGALARGHGIAGTAPLRYASLPRPWLDASDQAAVGELAWRIKDQAAGLVIIDHLAQVLGEVDENASGMASIMGSLRAVADETDCCLLLLSHQVKSAGRFKIPASESLRGHSSILASCDLASQVQRSKTEKTQVEIRPVAVRGADVSNFSATFTFEHRDPSGQELKTAKFWGAEPVGAEDLVADAVLDILADEPGINQTGLRQAAAAAVEDAGDPCVRKVIARMEREGEIIATPGAKGAKLYSLPGVRDE